MDFDVIIWMYVRVFADAIPEKFKFEVHNLINYLF